MKTFSDVIGLWDSLSQLAADLDVPYGVAKQWRRRGSIPADRWVGLIDAAQRRGFEGVTADLLAELARSRTSEAA
jgi:hypothetical protein